MSTYWTIWLFVFLPLSFAAGFITGFLVCICIIPVDEQRADDDDRIPRFLR